MLRFRGRDDLANYCRVAIRSQIAAIRWAIVIVIMIMLHFFVTFFLYFAYIHVLIEHCLIFSVHRRQFSSVWALSWSQIILWYATIALQHFHHITTIFSISFFDIGVDICLIWCTSLLSEALPVLEEWVGNWHACPNRQHQAPRDLSTKVLLIMWICIMCQDKDQIENYFYQEGDRKCKELNCDRASFISELHHVLVLFLQALHDL